MDAEPGKPKLLLTFGTLTGAIYIADREDPENPQVVATIKAGLQNCTLFRRDTPEKELRWLKDFHNRWHGGSQTSFMELIEEVVVVEAGWTLHKEKNALTSRTQTGDASYDVLYASFVETNYKSTFPTGLCYTSAKAFRNILVGGKFFDTFKNWVDEECDFLEPRITNEGVLRCLHQVALIIAKIKSSVNSDTYSEIMFEALKFAVQGVKDTWVGPCGGGGAKSGPSADKSGWEVGPRGSWVRGVML